MSGALVQTETASAVHESVLGKDHPDNVALVLKRKGDYERTNG
jgi:hypothetical protein